MRCERCRSWWRLAWWSGLLLIAAIWPPVPQYSRPHAPVGASDHGRPRPNILIIVGDDHAAGTLGIDGDRRAATPRLDALARRGVRFDRAYCNAPLCTPSRQSFITGRLPHAVGVTRLTSSLASETLTLGSWLTDLGYDTAAFGKMHFNPAYGGDNHHGFAARLDTADWLDWLAAHPPAGGDRRTKWRPFRTPADHWLNAAGRSFGLPAAAMESSFYVRAARAFLEHHRSGATRPPFALVVSFYEPHAPFKFPDGWQPRYRPEQFTDPGIRPQERASLPRVFASLTADQRKGIQASYFTSLGWLDHQIGQVLDALDASGQADDTVVVYLGDNGYLLGEHGRFEKHCFYEAAVRIPWIIRWPGHLPADHRVAGLVELVDLVPTLLDLVGAPLPPYLHGQSVRGLAEARPDARGHEVVVSEYLENEEAMARSERYKLIVAINGRERDDGYAPIAQPAGPTEHLFDLDADPGETTDLIDRPELAPVAASLRGALLDRLRSTRELRTPVPSALSQSAALRWCLTPQD